MMKVSILYPNKPGKPRAFHGDRQLYLDSIAAFLAPWKPVMVEVGADTAKYTDIERLILFNEVRRSA